MKLTRIRSPQGDVSPALWDEDQFRLLDSDPQYRTLSDILEAENPAQVVKKILEKPGREYLTTESELLAPIDQQEVWAAGVTYKRSKAARMEESEAAASCYDRVYVSPRPELFMKATPHRVSGPNQPLRIRQDSKWNVPEPEFTLVMNSRGEFVGATIGNDMSSRDIEGENPLYLPQAKVYDQCCGLGPCIVLTEALPARDTIGIRLAVNRNGETVFEDATSVDSMARSFEDLIGWLHRDQTFPQGVFLLTGTGIVPDANFTLAPGDEVTIEIDGLGSLTNSIVQG